MKLISKVLLLLTFFFVLIGKGYSVNDIYRAEQLLKNANTYYWYGRFRSNSLHEFEQSKLYCDSITRYLESYNGKDSLVLIRKSLIETEVSNLLITLSSMDTICVDNMNGRYPAYMELMGRSNEYEYFDDPDETGLEHALQELFKVPYPSKPIGERMFRVILIMRNKSVLLNEVAQQYIISHTNFFLTGSHEIPVLVDIHDINNIVLKDSILPNLCERYNLKEMGVIELELLDQLNGIYFWEANFSMYNPELKNYMDRLSSYGFRNDKREQWKKMVSRTLLYSLVNLLIFFFIIIIIISGKEKFKKFPFNEYLHSIAYFISAYLIALIVIATLLILIGNISPESNEFHGKPFNKFIWHLLLIPLSFSIVPLIIPYFLSARFFNRKLFRRYNILGVILGSQLAWPLVYTNNIYNKFSFLPRDYNLIFILSVILIYLICFLLSWNIYRRRHDKKKNIRIFDTISAILLIVALCVLPYINVLKPTLIFESIPLIVSLLMLIGISIIISIKVFLLLRKKKDNNEGALNYKVNRIFDKNYLNNWFAITAPYISIENSLEKSGSLMPGMEFGHSIFESEKLIHLISGESGVGKTRFVKELLKFYPYNDSNDIIAFYGDCDQYLETIQIPYEPFAEALGDYLEVEFKSVDSKLSNEFGKLLKSLDFGPSKLIGNIMDNSGAGTAANTKELADVIVNYFKRITAKENKKILFILDDIQWVDELTFDLLTEVILLVNKVMKTKIRFIFTLRSSTPIKEISYHELELIKDKTVIPEDIKYPFFHNESPDALYPIKFIEKFLDNSKEIRFNPQTVDSLIDIFSKLNLEEYKNPSFYIQYLKNINANNGFIIDNKTNQIVLSNDFDLSSIPLPGELGVLHNEMFNKLSNETINVLECAAFIGETFKASILSNVLNLDRVDLLRNLREAENAGFIEDVRPKDDYFKFKEKILIQELKKRLNVSEINDKLKYKVPQIVKEYHIRIINSILIEIFKENRISKFISINEENVSIEDLKLEIIKYGDINEIITLANHSLIVFDSIPAKVIEIVKAVSNKALLIKRPELALSLYRSLIAKIHKTIIQNDDNVTHTIKANSFAYKNLQIEGYSKDMLVYQAHELLSYELVEYMIRLNRSWDEIQVVINQVIEVSLIFNGENQEQQLLKFYFEFLNKYSTIARNDHDTFSGLSNEISAKYSEIKHGSYDLKIKFILLNYRCKPNYEIEKINYLPELFDKEISEIPKEIQNKYIFDINFRRGFLLNKNKEHQEEAHAIWNEQLQKFNLGDSPIDNFYKIISKYNDNQLHSIGLLLDYAARKSKDLNSIILSIKIFEYLSDYRSLVYSYEKFIKVIVKNSKESEIKLIINSIMVLLNHYSNLETKDKKNYELLIRILKTIVMLDLKIYFLSFENISLILNAILGIYRIENLSESNKKKLRSIFTKIRGSISESNFKPTDYVSVKKLLMSIEKLK